MYSRKVLRIMPPETRKLARLLNELESVHNRARNLLPKLHESEFLARASIEADNARMMAEYGKREANISKVD